MVDFGGRKLTFAIPIGEADSAVVLGAMAGSVLIDWLKPLDVGSEGNMLLNC